jgi:hypothetical protein
MRIILPVEFVPPGADVLNRWHNVAVVLNGDGKGNGFAALMTRWGWLWQLIHFLNINSKADFEICDQLDEFTVSAFLYLLSLAHECH